jgi:hypothetical protein
MTPRTKTFYYRDNTGGSNMRSNEANVNQGPQQTEMVLIQNMDIYREGGFQAQLGNRQLNSSVSDATAVLGIGQYRSGDNTFAIYTKASGNAYVLPIAGGAEGAAIKTGLNASAVPKFVEYNSKVIAFNGSDQPWSWNGTASANLTGTPAAWATTKPTTADIDGGKRIFAAAGSSVYYNALGNENDWTTAADAGSFSNIFNDNTTITNVTNYGSKVSFHTGKPAIYLLSGSAPSSYSIDRIASNRAAPGKNAAATAQDYQYFFCGDAILPLITTDLGVVKLGKDYDISRKIKPFITGTESELPINSVDITYNRQVTLLPYDFKNQLITFFKTTGNTTFDTAAIFNLDNASWVFRKATPATCAARVGDYILIGTSDGRIIQEFYGTTLVSGAFQKRVLSPFFDFGAPDRFKQIVRFYIVFKSTTNLNVTFNLYTDYSSTLRYTQNITSTGISASAYGSAIYGTSTYASSQILDIQFPLNMQAKSFQFELLSADSTVDFRVIFYAFEVEGLDAH